MEKKTVTPEISSGSAAGRRLPPVLWLTVTAMLMALNVVFSSFSIPVPGGHMYLNDLVVVLAAVLMDPLAAVLAGGVGAFLGDLLFYPAPMLVSLITHGVQALAVALLVLLFRRRFGEKREIVGAVLGAVLGVAINVGGYTLGRTFVYATWEAALLKLPYQVLQAAVGSALGLILAYPCRLRHAFRRICRAR